MTSTAEHGRGRLTATYRDPMQPLQQRVDDLMARMTLEEKAAQLGSAWVFQIADGARFDADRAAPLLKDGIGQITRVSGAGSLMADEAAVLANDIQRHLIESTRLGIPAILHEEICSGLMAREAIMYPQAIGVASTWNPTLNELLAVTVREQMRAMGSHQGLSPVLDVCRDPRWGRTEESYGEDPHLVARMGVAFVRGLQGDDLTSGVIATAKHFVGYSMSEGGMNWAPAHIGQRELRDVYLYPFEAAVCEAGVRSVMNGYHELDGVPCGASQELLTRILRDEWGFEGCVVADYFSVRQLADYHHLATDSIDAANIALTAGIDVELPGTDCYGEALLQSVRSGCLSEAVVDTAVARVLRTKFELGLFEQPFVDVASVAAATRRPEHSELAKDIALASLVLLKNDGTLPMRSDLAHVAVIGPNAHSARNLLGDYSYPAHIESLLEVLKSGRNVFAMPIEQGVDVSGVTGADEGVTVFGSIRDRLGDGRVAYARGCDVNSDDRSGFAEAVELAAAADVAVLVMGDQSGLTDGCTSGESRDVASLDLPGVQEELVLAVAASGTPIVLVLVSGRPNGSPRVHDAANAVVMAWLPGERGAEAIADVLSGAANPGGKLPMSYPRSAGQIPVFYGHKISGGRSHWKGDYVDESCRPLYPFGFGKSYTSFALSTAPIESGPYGVDDSIAVEVGLENIGSVRGDEVVQLYIRDPRASITRPVLELKNFARVSLEPGERAAVTFDVPVAQLGFHGLGLAYQIESGTIEVFVGTSARDVDLVGTVDIVTPSGTAVVKAFTGTATVLR